MQSDQGLHCLPFEVQTGQGLHCLQFEVQTDQGLHCLPFKKQSDSDQGLYCLPFYKQSDLLSLPKEEQSGSESAVCLYPLPRKELHHLPMGVAV